MTHSSSYSEIPLSFSPLEKERTSLESIPEDMLLSLFDGAATALDPAKRDYGERYLFLGVIGEGGQGVVVSARDRLLDRVVAIKALKSPPDPVKEAQLEREAKLCGSLEHPNIPPTYDLAYDETGSPLFVMRKIEGQSLEDLLRQHSRDGKETKPYSRIRLLNIFLQVCHAIEYAHSRGILHLDLKPSNIWIGPFEEIYILDWGSAQRAGEVQSHLAGTPLYVAPERLQGGVPDARSDVYSLGVMLYRMLTDHLPREIGKIDFRTYRETYRAYPIIPPRERDRTIPPDLAAIILKAMAEDPAARYATVHDLAEDLQRFLDLLPVEAYREGIGGVIWKFIRRHQRNLAILAAMLMILAVAAWIHMEKREVAEELARTQAAARLAEARAEAERQALRRRARARIPLRKATELMEKIRDAVDQEPDRERRLTLLQPVFSLLETVLREDSETAEAFYERGKAYYLARDMALALADFRRAYTVDPSFIMANYYAGLIYQDVYRDYEAARREFEAMKRIDQENEYSELGQARLDLAAGRYEEALQRCDRIEKLNPGIIDLWFLRGLIYQNAPNLRDPDRAMAAYDRYLALRRDNPTAYHNRGDLRKDRQDYEGAIADYTAALAVKPDYLWSLNNRGYLLYKEKDLPLEGLRDIERALAIVEEKRARGIALTPQEERAHFWSHMDRAAIYEYLGRPEEAEKDYRWARTADPQNPQVWHRTGVFLFRQGDLQGAEEAFTQAIRLFSEESNPYRSYHCRGVVRLARLAYADAVSDFEEALRLRTEGRVYSCLMRWIALKMGGMEEPDRAHFERHLDAPPDSPWMAALGSYYLHEVKAEDVLALAKTPKALCEVEFYLGAYALAEGDRERAIRHFRRTLQTQVHLFLEYAVAKVFLKRLTADSGDDFSVGKGFSSPSSSPLPKVEP